MTALKRFSGKAIEMSTAAPEILPQLITADELLAMGDIGRCELIYGELIMMSPAGAEHGMVAGRVLGFLASFVQRHGTGIILAAETGFKLGSNPDSVRAPDASFIRKDRLQSGLPKGFFAGSPDLAVEVVSPGDTHREVAEKLNQWLAGGAHSVWVVDPSLQTLTIHRVGQPPVKLTAGQTLTDEPLLPGFELEIGRLFELP